MTPERLEAHKLAMFPMMLQALYNAAVTLGMSRSGQLANLDRGDAKRKTMDDIKFILDTFKSIGVYKRYKRRQIADGVYTLHHFDDDTIESLLERFDPDAEEHDDKLEEYRESAKKNEETLVAAVRRRDDRIAALNSECENIRMRLAKAEDELRHYTVFDKTSKRLNDMLRYPMTAEEMRNEIRGIVGVGHDANED